MKKYANKLGIKYYGNWFKVCYIMEINSKTFAIPILTAIVNYKLDTVRIWIANTAKKPWNMENLVTV